MSQKTPKPQKPKPKPENQATNKHFREFSDLFPELFVLFQAFDLI